MELCTQSLVWLWAASALWGMRWDTKKSTNGSSLFTSTCKNELEVTELREKGNTDG